MNTETSPTPDNTGSRLQKFSEDFRSSNWFFYLCASLGVLAIYFHTGNFTAASTPFLWALSCSASGAAIGFLFGIPRILQGDRVTAPIADAANPKPSQVIDYRQQVNTNLEQISDWLTKIIVGLGLVQLGNLPGFLNSTAATLAGNMGSASGHQAFALALIIYFSLIGFLYGYLATRLFLAAAFSRADQTANALDRIQTVSDDVDAQKAILQRIIPLDNPISAVSEEGLKVHILSLLDEDEWKQLRKLASGEEFDYVKQPSFEAELRRLQALGFITNKPNTTISALPEKDDLRKYIEITDRGKQYFAVRNSLENDSPKPPNNSPPPTRS